MSALLSVRLKTRLLVLQRPGTSCVFVAVAASCFLAAPASPYNQDDLEIHDIDVDYLGSGFHGDKRRLDAAQTCPQIVSGTSYAPFRIGYELVPMTGVTAELQTFVRDTLMARAAAYWSATLQVRQATTPLRFARKGSECLKYAFESGYVCKKVSSPTCGTEGFTVPDKYLKSFRTCPSGHCSPTYRCPVGTTADFEAWANQKGSYTCTFATGNSQGCPSGCTPQTATYHTSLAEKGITCDVGTCTAHAEGAGAVGKDFFMFVDIQETEKCKNSGALQAYAGQCAKDQCDRPIFGYVNFCLSKLKLDAKELEYQVSTAVHELGHALGFDSSQYKNFRDAAGAPRIARSPSNQDTFPGEVRWKCDGTSVTFPLAGGTRHYVDVSPLVGIAAERGMTNCGCPIGTATMDAATCVTPSAPDFQKPSCVIQVRTARVLQEVRDHFDCQTLTGAELENQDTGRCDLLGSHWEQRIFNGEIMASAGSPVAKAFLSRVTLAFFQDSGWYDVDFSMADTIVKDVDWGYKQGCAFAREKCITNGVSTAPTKSFWCTDPAKTTCAGDRRGVIRCAMKELVAAVPPPFDYFTGADSRKIGILPMADYCPFYATIIADHQCVDASSGSWAPFNNVNFMREVFGTSSRCLHSDLRKSVSTGSGGTFPAKASYFPTKTPACYYIVCAADKLSYTVKMATDGIAAVSDTATTADVGTCTSEAQTLTVTDYEGSIQCAHPAQMCGQVPRKHTTTCTGGIPCGDSTTGTAATGGNNNVGNNAGGSSTTTTTSAASQEGEATTTTTPQTTVVSSFTVVNVGYNQLKANAALLANFKLTIREKVAEAAGAGITEDHVVLNLAAGSVAVTATITPPSGVSVSGVQSAITAGTTLASSIATAVGNIPGIAAVSSGTITAAIVTVTTTTVAPSSNIAGGGRGAANGAGPKDPEDQTVDYAVNVSGLTRGLWLLLSIFWSIAS